MQVNSEIVKLFSSGVRKYLWTVGWIDLKFSTEIHAFQRMNSNVKRISPVAWLHCRWMHRREVVLGDTNTIPQVSVRPRAPSGKHGDRHFRHRQWRRPQILLPVCNILHGHILAWGIRFYLSLSAALRLCIHLWCNHAAGDIQRSPRIGCLGQNACVTRGENSLPVWRKNWFLLLLKLKVFTFTSRYSERIITNIFTGIIIIMRCADY